MNTFKKSAFILAFFFALATTGAIAGETTDKPGGNTITVELVGTTPSAGEPKEVIKALQKLLAALAHRDLNHVGSCLSPDVTILDERTHKFIHGKEAVLEHVKANVVGKENSHPVKELKVHNPFVNVTGETAMVSFKATKELGDPKSTKMESWCSEIFERKNGEWLVLQLNTNWKVIR